MQSNYLPIGIHNVMQWKQGKSSPNPSQLIQVAIVGLEIKQFLCNTQLLSS